MKIIIEIIFEGGQKLVRAMAQNDAIQTWNTL